VEVPDKNTPNTNRWPFTRRERERDQEMIICKERPHTCRLGEGRKRKEGMERGTSKQTSKGGGRHRGRRQGRERSRQASKGNNNNNNTYIRCSIYHHLSIYYPPLPPPIHPVKREAYVMEGGMLLKCIHPSLCSLTRLTSHT